MAIELEVIGKTCLYWKWFSLCKSETELLLIFINYMIGATIGTRTKSITQNL